MDVGKRHKTLESDKKDFIIHQMTSSISFTFATDPSAFHVLWGNVKWHRWMSCKQWVRITAGDPWVYQAWIFYMGSKPTCLTLPWREPLSLLYWSVNTSALCSEEWHYLYYPRLSIEKINHSKAGSVSAHKICRNTRDQQRIAAHQRQ